MRKRWALVAFILQSSLLFAETWNVDAAGNWNTASNWSPNSVPNGIDAVANFGNIISANRTITLDISATVGTITFDNANNYLILQSGVNAFTFDVAVGSAQITVTTTHGNGSHTIAAPITLNDNLVVTQGSTGTLTLSGVLSESGARSVTKTGAGVLSLTGSNTFSGGISLQAGTLDITGNSALGTGDVTIAAGTFQAGGSFTATPNFSLTGTTATFDSQANALTLSGTVSGGASLVKTGSGTLALTNAGNSYSGGTTINAGTLSFGADAHLGNAAGAITLGNGTLQATATFTSARSISLTGAGSIDPVANTLTLSGTITGSGSLTKVSTGTLVLSGASNSYSGGTTINAGVLSIGADANLGASSSSITLGAGTLLTSASFSSSRPLSLTGAGTIDTGANTLSLSGVVSGSGSLTKVGAGTLVLSGTNTYSGGNTVSAGTLQGNSNSLQGNISNAATVVFNQTLDGTYSGALSGAGALSKIGDGLLILTGDSSAFTGTTAVSAGTLQVDGKLNSSSQITISSGATLSGSGRVGSLVDNSGTIRPGSSIGTLIVEGDLTLQPSSTLAIEIAPLSSDLIQVTGAANLDGALVIEPLPGFYGFSASYTVLTANPVAGTLSTSSTNSNFIPDTTISSSAVTLFIRVLQPFFDFPFANENVARVGENFDALSLLGTLEVDADLVAALNTLVGKSFATINAALDQLHPAQLGDFSEWQSALGAQLCSLFHRRPPLSCYCNASWRFWAAPFGNWIREKAKGEQIGFSTRTTGAALGIDKEFSNGWTLGIGGACNDTDLRWHRRRGSAEIQGVYGALYADFATENRYTGLSVLAGYDFCKTTRAIRFETVDRGAVSHSKALDAMGQFSWAYFFGSPACHLFPYLNLDLFYLKRASFKEKGAGSLNLDVKSNKSWTLRGETGIGLEIIDRNRDETICLSPLIAMGWTLEHPIWRDRFTAQFSQQPIPFTVEGRDATWGFLSLQFGLKLSCRCASFSGEYRIDTSPKGGAPYFDQRAALRLDLSW